MRMLDDAERDETSRAAREHLCQRLAETFRAVGHQLWHYGFVIGGDRVEGKSPFGFGDDALVGLATVTQIAGELTGGAVLLLDGGNPYAAAALVRQMVETEQLLWDFAQDRDQAALWLRSQRDERLRAWQPRHVRKRSEGRFRDSDYHLHCERGGHPTPEAMALLPCHQSGLPTERWELATHGASASTYMLDAANRFGYGDEARQTARALGLPDALSIWRREDRMGQVLAALQAERSAA
jgi:hypothetical protein